MAKKLVEESSLTAVADSIREKTGGAEPLVFPEGFVTAIQGITTGGSGGTGSGGDAPEWIKDGNTHIWITLHEGRTSPMLGVCPKGTVTVDWGDGATPDVLTGTSTSTVKWTPNHEYASAGEYIITLTVDGEMGFYGTSSLGSGVLCYTNGSDNRNRVYQNSVRFVEIGNGVTSIGSHAFSSCYSLTNVVIPEGVTSIGSSSFYNCYSLTNVVIPDGVTAIGCSAFSSCYSLTNVVIPEGVTSIGSGAFYGCYSLTNVVIPGSVTSIGSTAFYYCYGIAFYDFSNHTAVPTLSSADAFNGIPADCEIRVPAALYDEWIAATNWSTYASQIVAV